MICLRCGYCCKWLSVVIVDDPEIGPTKENLIFHKGDGVSCKHLKGSKPGEYSCAIHDKKWYEETPCFAHTQIESRENTPCRMGNHILNNVLTPEVLLDRLDT